MTGQRPSRAREEAKRRLRVDTDQYSEDELANLMEEPAGGTKPLNVTHRRQITHQKYRNG